MKLIANQFVEKIIINKRNKISLAFTLKKLKNPIELGAWLFNRGIMGARVVIKNENAKKIGNHEFKNYGGHTDDYPELFPYITLAVAIGSTRTELENFIIKFKKTYQEIYKKNK